MTFSIAPMAPAEVGRIKILPDAGFGALLTDRGNLPLDRLDVRSTITGLLARTVVAAEFVNVHDTALEATYVFPLPDRAAVTGMTMTADGHTVEAELQERGAAREAYDQAVAEGKRASIAEEDRPDVFTMRVGNIMPGEHVTVELRLVGPLPFEDGAATFRFPLVVAPRYIPGTPLGGPQAGDGRELDTDAVPDASRISPPVLLPGFPNPLRLSLDVDIDPAGLELGEVRSSLHTVVTDERRISLKPGERADRDFILRLAYAGGGETAIAAPDQGAGDGGGDGGAGTYQLTVLPPDTGTASRAKDVVLLLDRSGSMGGWKMVAARRAAARVVDTLTAGDRFAVLTFDHIVEHPEGLQGDGLSEASDRHRFRAVEHLSRADARGGTEMLAPLLEGLRLLKRGDETRDRVLVLITDGQVGNEDQILREITPLIGTTRVHTVGIDRAVNAGFLGRLATLGGGRTELVESEDRLDDAMEHIHRRIGSPAVTDLRVSADGLALLEETRSPQRLSALYPGVPLVVTGRYAGEAGGTLTVTGQTRDGREWTTTVAVQTREEPAITAQWARARLRDLEDRYATGDRSLERTIVATSLRFGVLCRFTAFVAVDSRVVNEGGETRRVTQPVEFPSGWEAPMAGGVAMPMSMSLSAPAGGPASPPPMPPSFAPVRAAAAGGRQPRARRSAPQETASVMSTFAAIPAKPALISADELRRLARLEADRLRAAQDRPEYERRELLADLVSRLEVLLAGVPGNPYPDLTALVERLKIDGPLDAKWAEALRTLSDFADGGTGGASDATGGASGTGERPGRQSGQRPGRKAFWKS